MNWVKAENPNLGGVLLVPPEVARRPGRGEVGSCGRALIGFGTWGETQASLLNSEHVVAVDPRTRIGGDKRHRRDGNNRECG